MGLSITRCIPAGAGPMLVVGCANAPARVASDCICDRSGPISVGYMGDIAMVRTADGAMHRLARDKDAGRGVYRSATHGWRAMGSGGEWTVGRMLPERCERARQPR